MKLCLPIAALALSALASTFVFALRWQDATRAAAVESHEAAETGCQLVESQRRAAALEQEVRNLKARVSRARKNRDRAESKAELARAELRASQDERDKLSRRLRIVRGESTILPDSATGETRRRIEDPEADIAEMEKLLVEVSRAKNDLEQAQAYLRERSDFSARRITSLENQLREAGIEPAPAESWESTESGGLHAEPKIDGVVLGVSDKVNLILISVGGKEKVRVGYKFTVYSGDSYHSKLVVDKVEDGWAACRELTDFRKEPIQQGDSVSTRVFD